MRWTKRSIVTVVVAMAGLMIFGGGAWAAGRFIITNINQIKPSVRAQLRRAAGQRGDKGPQGSRAPREHRGRRDHRARRECRECRGSPAARARLALRARSPRSSFGTISSTSPQTALPRRSRRVMPGKSWSAVKRGRSRTVTPLFTSSLHVQPETP
jgi:hypothetical protein